MSLEAAINKMKQEHPELIKEIESKAYNQGFNDGRYQAELLTGGSRLLT